MKITHSNFTHTVWLLSIFIVAILVPIVSADKVVDEGKLVFAHVVSQITFDYGSVTLDL